MIILEGRKLAEKILADLKNEIKCRNLELKLAVVLIGNNRISEIYIKEKEKACQTVGVGFRLFKFPAGITTKELKTALQQIVQNPANAGAIVQLPLPKHIDTAEILNTIPQEKDVDVLSEKSLGKFYQGISLILPPVVCAVSQLFKAYGIKMKGKHAVIVGAGRLVGKPMALWLQREGAAVSVLDSSTKNISFFTKNADIIISGVGKPDLITGDMVKRGVVVIDAGTSVEGGKSKGDVEFQSVSKKASYITPVPGGVGPLTVACLFSNLMTLNELPRPKGRGIPCGASSFGSSHPRPKGRGYSRCQNKKDSGAWNPLISYYYRRISVLLSHNCKSADANCHLFSRGDGFASGKVAE